MDFYEQGTPLVLQRVKGSILVVVADSQKMFHIWSLKTLVRYSIICFEGRAGRGTFKNISGI